MLALSRSCSARLHFTFLSLIYEHLTVKLLMCRQWHHMHFSNSPPKTCLFLTLQILLQECDWPPENIPVFWGHPQGYICGVSSLLCHSSWFIWASKSCLTAKVHKWLGTSPTGRIMVCSFSKTDCIICWMC